MLGSTIVYIPTLPKDINTLFEKIIDEGLYDEISLIKLTTLDFSVINIEKGTSWDASNNPIVYDEENGIVITHINKDGLNTVLNFKGSLDNIEPQIVEMDIKSLQNFVDQFGVDHLYEVVTF
jgi:hypothetical protein